VIKDNLKLTDFMSSDAVCPAGVYTEIGAKKCDAGVRMFYGQNTGSNFETAVGRLFVDLKDTADAALTDMKIRLSVKDSQSITKKVIGEWNADNLNQNSTDRRGWEPLPFQPMGVKEDSYLCIDIYNGNAASKTIDVENSTVSIDITKELV
jgi:hypothetical protein